MSKEARWNIVIPSNACSVFAGTGLAWWLASQQVDTITVVSYDIATAVAAEDGLRAEVLSDTSGAIHLANEAGKVQAKNLYETLMVLLQSNFAAVASTEAWVTAVESGTPLTQSGLGTSASQGAEGFHVSQPDLSKD